jgi:hypothetical protein
VVAAIEAIEAFGFKSRPDGEVWCKAEIIRCAFLVEETAKLKAASQWQEVLAKLDFVQRLQNELKLELPSAALKQMEALESWARGEHEKDRKDREFSALIAELYFRVQQSEEKDTSARYIKLPELRDDSEALHKVWRSLTDFTRPIPEDATAAFRKRSALLDAEIARRTAIRFRTILVSSAAALVVGAVIVWFVLGQMKAGEFVKQLQAAVAQHQARAAEQLIERLHTSEKRLLRVGSVNAALATAETFITEERALLANFETAFAKLPSKLSGDPNSTQINAIADQLTQTRAALNALAPDLKTENEPRVQAFEQQWRQYLSEGGVLINGILDQWISSAEKQCDQLDYRTPVKTATAQISTLSGVIQKIDDCEVGFKNHVNLRSDLVQRATAVRVKFTAYDRELRKIDDGIAALKKATSFADYSSAISLIASSEFSSAPAVVTLRDFFAEREAVIRSENQAREEAERRAREVAERQTREREERRQAELLLEERRKNDLLQASMSERQRSESPSPSQTIVLKPHRAGTILTLGIIGLIICGPLCIAAWLMGDSDIREMDAGLMDKSGRSTTSTGRALGVLGSILWIIAIVYFIIF